MLVTLYGRCTGQGSMPEPDTGSILAFCEGTNKEAMAEYAKMSDAMMAELGKEHPEGHLCTGIDLGADRC